MKGLILAGGFGTRLRPLTYTGSKQLIPVANKPILFYVIENLKAADIKDIGIVVGETKQDIIDKVGDGSKFGVGITYIEQEAPLGLAHAIKISVNFLKDDSFVMYLGDNLLKEGIKQLIEKFKRSKPNALILLTKVKNPQEFGVAIVDEKGVVQRLIEKPKEPPSDLALVGVYMFDNNIYTAINHIKPSWRNELEITDAIQWLLDNKYRVESHLVKGWWKDTGKPEDIVEANLLILEDLVPLNEGTAVNSEISSKVRIEKGAAIEDSTIRGPTIIGRNVKIKRSYIGPFSAIGDDVVIEDSEVECSIIMENSKVIKVKTRIDRSVIGKGVTITQKDHSPRTYRFIIGDQSYIELVK